MHCVTIRLRGAKHEDLDNAVYHCLVQVRERKLLMPSDILKERQRTLRLPLAQNTFIAPMAG